MTAEHQHCSAKLLLSKSEHTHTPTHTTCPDTNKHTHTTTHFHSLLFPPSHAVCLSLSVCLFPFLTHLTPQKTTTDTQYMPKPCPRGIRTVDLQPKALPLNGAGVRTLNPGPGGGVPPHTNPQGLDPSFPSSTVSLRHIKLNECLRGTAGRELVFHIHTT